MDDADQTFECSATVAVEDFFSTDVREPLIMEMCSCTVRQCGRGMRHTGLRPGDHITHVDGVAIGSSNHFRQVICHIYDAGIRSRPSVITLKLKRMRALSACSSPHTPHTPLSAVRSDSGTPHSCRSTDSSTGFFRDGSQGRTSHERKSSELSRALTEIADERAEACVEPPSWTPTLRAMMSARAGAVNSPSAASDSSSAASSKGRAASAASAASTSADIASQSSRRATWI